MALKYMLVDVIPKDDSDESFQDSEPSVTVDPLDANQLIAGAFGSGGASYFESTDSGAIWSDYGSVPSSDKSLAWLFNGSAALTVSLTNTAISTYSGTTADSDFGLPINVFRGGDLQVAAGDLDQPWIRTGPSDHVYVAYNDLDNCGIGKGGHGNGGTASVLVSSDGGNDYTPVTLDRVGTTLQDDPSVRLAVYGNTVYAMFVRWNSQIEDDANGQRYASQVVVVRSDDGGADDFTALGARGNGVQVAAPISVFTDTGGSSLSIGNQRDGAEGAIAVDPNNANHVVIAYEDAPGPDGAGVVQLVLAESDDGGETWSTKFTTSSSIRSGQPAISILENGAIGFLYDSYDPTTDELSQQFLITADDFATTSDTVLGIESNAIPNVQFDPYLGDFFDLTSVGNTFYGTFCASNADDGFNAQFANLTLQRDFTGTMGTGSFRLTDGNGNPVQYSIDPYFFSCTLAPPMVAGLSDASYTTFASPVTLSPGLSVDDVSSTTLDSAIVQITDGMFAGDMLAADTNGTAITTSYNSATGALTLTGADTLADYEAVLESVTFSSTSADPTNSGNDDTRTVSWSVNDGLFASAPDNSTITLPTNPPPPADTTAVMIMHQPANGNYEIYDLGQNVLLAAYHLTQINSPWQVVGLGSFGNGDTSDMMLRNGSTGAFQIYNVSGNNVTGAAAIGQIGLEWQVLGFGNFSGTGIGTDMLMRNSINGDLEVFDISNNTVAFTGPMGQIGLEWQVLGFGNFSGTGTGTDMLMRNSTNDDLEVFNISNNTVTFTGPMGAIGLEWQVLGFGDISSTGMGTDMLMRDSIHATLEVFNISNNTITFAGPMGAIGPEWFIDGISNSPASAPPDTQLSGPAVSPTGAAASALLGQLTQAMASFAPSASTPVASSLLDQAAVQSITAGPPVASTEQTHQT